MQTIVRQAIRLPSNDGFESVMDHLAQKPWITDEHLTAVVDYAHKLRRYRYHEPRHGASIQGHGYPSARSTSLGPVR